MTTIFDERLQRMSVRAWASAAAAIPARLIPAAMQTETQRRRAAEQAYQREYIEAQARLMTSARATPPRPNTVRRMMRLLRANGPSTKGAVIQMGGDRLLHPTKGLRRV